MTGRPICPDSRFAVEYHVVGAETEARRKADLICIDQTVEASEELLRGKALRTEILGRVERIQAASPGLHRVWISFPCALLDVDFVQLLNVVFGISSLKPGIRVARLELPDETLRPWRGPRFGAPGLRQRCGVMRRPLVCGVLKPLGTSPRDLAELAYQLASGGLDLVKDDQSFSDHSFSPFHDRVSRCAEAVTRANAQTGRQCLYLPHISAAAETMLGRGRLAARAGAGGLLICPGLTGYDAMAAVARDDAIALPILSHPALLGSFCAHAESGMAPAVVYGQLPRLAGADASLHPRFGLEFPMTRADCLAVATEARRPWGPLAPILPAVGGRIGREQVQELSEAYRQEVVLILGSRIYRDPRTIQSECRQFMDLVESWCPKREA